jgi:hypothetical protein
MTFNVRDISVLCYAQGFTLWHYKGGVSTLSDITGLNFFDLANAMFNDGDMIMISAFDGGNIFFVKKDDNHIILNKMV